MQDFFDKTMTSNQVQGGTTAALDRLEALDPNAGWRRWLTFAKQGISPFSSEFAQCARDWRAEVPMILEETLPRLDVGETLPYLPIEALRDEHQTHRLFQGTKVDRVFRSSGTTSTSRSQSFFSSIGLSLYHFASLYTFRSILDIFLGSNRSNVRGVSLIPRETDWVDSSLAQMVAWISEVETVQYLSRTQWFDLEIAADPRPLWLFGTAFHIMDLIDTPGVSPLPPGSLVIETGGTKGRARPLPRNQFYQLISSKLGVPPERIISEYGMCEMASQAYDFVPPGTVRPLAARTFRFPAWVQTYVVPEVRRGQREGAGLLAIRDPLRLDYPWILRTEDLVSLSSEGFGLLGRLDRAPLKGCSLRVDQDTGWEGGEARPLQSPSSGDDVLESDNQSGLETAGLRPRTGGSVLQAFLAHPDREAMARAALDLLAQLETEGPSLAAELGSDRAARSAYQDLRRSAPTTVDGLLTAAARAVTPLTKPRWLIVLPESHSLVGIYPILLGYLLGLRMTVRLPTRFQGEVSFISRFLARLQALPLAQIQVVGSSLRIEAGNQIPELWDHVMVYGDDSTVADFKRILPMPVQGFGGRIGMTIAALSDLETLGVGELVRDALSLGQMGCMATRLTLVHIPQGDLLESQWARVLGEAMASFWGEDLPLSRRAGLDGEAWRLERRDFRCWAPQPTGLGLVATRQVAIQDLESSVTTHDLAMAPFTLPVILIRGGTIEEYIQKVAMMGPNLPPLAACSVTASVLETVRRHTFIPWLHSSLRPIGQSNAPIWDGRHEGLPLFFADYGKIGP